MDFTFRLLNGLRTAHGIPGNQAPQREISRKYPNPLGDFPKGKFGRVICQNIRMFRAPHVMLDELIYKNNFEAQHNTKVGFINFFARRQNV